MFIIIGIIWVSYILIKAAIDDADIRSRSGKNGFDTYRSTDGSLRHTSSGKKLSQSEINAYYMGKRGK